MHETYLSHFHTIRPPHESSQEQTLEWLIEAHVEAERKAANLSNVEVASFRSAMREKVERVSCKKEALNKRGHVVADYLHLNWAQMEIYSGGVGLGERARYFAKHANALFEKFYELELVPPREIIHVTCTGYASPSGAQRLIASKQWGQSTTATHAYHMGCYGSIPAIRMAKGTLQNNPDGEKIDIVHTEICSLHTNPASHRLDQLVSESLFADGFIKYSVSRNEATPSLALLASREEILPDSAHAMSWTLADWGFEISLAKEIPVLIAKALQGYLDRLGASPLFPKRPLFAIHPGGPKILAQIQKLLSLSEEQMRHSKQILRECGNMSSATLPHIWQAILEDPQIPPNTPIVSLAFGPGLTICGAILEKRCG